MPGASATVAQIYSVFEDWALPRADGCARAFAKVVWTYMSLNVVSIGFTKFGVRV